MHMHNYIMSITYGYNSKQGVQPYCMQCVCVTMVAEWQNSSYIASVMPIVDHEGSTTNLP